MLGVLSPSPDPEACLQGLALRVVLGWLWCTNEVPDSFPDLQEARTLRNRMEAVFRHAGSILKLPKMPSLARQSKERSQTLRLPFLESQECILYFLNNEGLCVCVSGKLFRFL